MSENVKRQQTSIRCLFIQSQFLLANLFKFNMLLIHKSGLFSGGRGFPGSKQLAVLLRTKDEGCFGDPAEGAEGA